MTRWACAPNYINLLGYTGGDAAAFVREQPGLFARGAREMGYRLLPTKVTYPATIRAGEPFTIQTTWINKAVGRAMRDFHLVLSVSDRTCDGGVTGSDKWIKGKTYDVRNRATLDGVAPGTYTLRIGLTDGGKPIALPLREGDESTYPVGRVIVAP
jgi:hypothetical protein